MVKEIISFVTLLVLSVAIALIGTAVLSYLEQDILSLIIAVVLLIVLCVANQIVSIAFFPAKVLAKLPVISFADKVCGAVIGVLETILILWTLYTLLVTINMGAIGQQIFVWVQENAVLRFLYEYNYLAKWIGMLSDKLVILPM
jgi:hypothetical protein